MKDADRSLRAVELSSRVSSGDLVAEGPAIRDAGDILARAQADESAAEFAREGYRTSPMSSLEPDERIRPRLEPAEQLLAVRGTVVVERRVFGSTTDATTHLAGDLYLTSRRLLFLGRVVLAFPLDEIEDVILVGERLLLAMSGGRGASLDASEPRLLRVQIAAARIAART